MNFKDKKIWLYADPHFGHSKVIEYCDRPFKTVTEMNNTLIKNFNKVVGKNDIVFILGDLSWLNKKSTTQIVKSLNGFKYLIKGNHDRKGNQYYRNMGFVEVYDFPIVIGNAILSHEPLYLKDECYKNFHGHLHNKSECGNICVSVECTNYYPVLLHNLYEFKEWKPFSDKLYPLPFIEVIKTSKE